MNHKWEYCTAYTHARDGTNWVTTVKDDQGEHTHQTTNLLAVVNALGESGWEAFAVHGAVTWLKRRKD